MNNTEAASILERQACDTCSIKELCSDGNCQYKQAIRRAIVVLKNESPKYIVKVKNLTNEDKKHIQEEWKNSADGLFVVPDDYEIVPIATTKLVIVKNKQGQEFDAYYDESRQLVFVRSYTWELLTSLGYTITIKKEQLRGDKND